MISEKMIEKRSELYANIRSFFRGRGYLEVDTPTLSPDLIPEATIENFATQFSSEFLGTRELYMIPSPEIFMKKLMAQFNRSVFQISKCFRNAEQLGSLHNPEFTMLEYYTVGYDEKDSITLTREMLAETAIRGCSDAILREFEVVSMRDLFKRTLNLDLDELQNPADLRKAAQEEGLQPGCAESWDDTFNRIFMNFVEPALNTDHPVVVTDYPRQIECLALENGNYRKRWEMYCNGIEIANCYAEETDALKAREYYRKEYAKLLSLRGESGAVIPDCDLSFCSIFDGRFPKSSGVAIGLDRLLMAETAASSIEDTLCFPFSGF